MPSATHDILDTTLANGVRVLCERHESAQSCAARVFVPIGVIHEEDPMRGAAPVAAELLLRGSRTHNSREQADLFDLAGAPRECVAQSRCVSVSAVTLGDRIGDAVPLLSDMILDPAMRDESVEPSKEIAISALASLEDDPQQRAVLSARERHLRSPFNRNTMGTPDGIASITPDSIRSWYTPGPQGAVVALAGAIRLDDAAALVDSCFGAWAGEPKPHTPGGDPPRGYAHEVDASNQSQIVVVHDAPQAGHADEYLELLTTNVLSGGMSGRLFSEVREKRGLCYAVSSSYRTAKEHGVVTSYVGTTPERAQESLDVLVEQLRAVSKGDISDRELSRAKIGLKSRLVFSGESTSGRASALIADAVKRGSPRTLDEITARIDAVTLDELNAYVRRRDLGSMTVQTLGPAPLDSPV